ncbi:MAG: SDR family NAD(P)-dependent oxidoreductase, partial [Leifsonia sp.]
MSPRTIVVVGGTSGIGLELARRIVSDGDRVVITGRDQNSADEIAAGIGPAASAVAVDISEPETIAASLAGIEHVDGLVLAAIERDANNIRDYDVA